MFKDTQSHGLVSLQFLSAVEIFFGLDISMPKRAITEFKLKLYGPFFMDGVQLHQG